LSNAVRNRLNLLILNGVPYNDIIKRLGPKGVGLTKDNLSEWFKGGYKEWREENRRIEQFRKIRDVAIRLVKENEGNAIQEAALSIAASHIYDLLCKFDPSILEETFKGDPEDYARIIRALFQISGGGLKYEQYRAKVAETKAKIERTIKASRSRGVITPETLKKIEEQLRLL